MKKIMVGLLMGLMPIALQAQDVIVSWVSNGVVEVSGMQPGDECSLEWASDLQKGFSTGAPQFDGLFADSNGTVRVEIPMFFRARIGVEGMVLIPSGVNSGTDPDFGAYSLTNATPFHMDATEVTKAQWDVVRTWALTNGYSFTNAGLGKATTHPVQTVNWYDCVKWCNARSEMDGRTPVYTVSGSIYKTGQNTNVAYNVSVNGYRLPTIVEWEYAARGGLSGKRFPWGDTITHSNANYYSSAVYTYDISPTRGYHPSAGATSPRTMAVKSFAANGYGLYDMSGNVWEWCWNASDSYRNIRGGSWGDLASYVRCGVANWYFPDNADHYYGFRAVCR